MAYISKYSGEELDNAIIVNEDQDNRLNSLETNLSNLNNTITTVLNTELQPIKNNITDLQSQINNMHIPNIQLNYSIIGGTTQPTNPTENMIWINTDQTITSILFDAATPETASEGTVWIITSATSNAGFYMLDIDNILADKIYPIGVKQYIENSWVQKTGQIYKDGAWVNFETYLFSNGVYQTENKMVAYGSGTLKLAGGFLRSYMPENEYATYVFDKQIDTRNYSKVEIAINGGSINYNIWFGFSESKGVVPTNVNVNVFEISSVLIPRNGTTVTAGVYTIDLSNINDKLWFGFLTSGSSSSNTSTYGYGGIDIISIVFK